MASTDQVLKHLTCCICLEIYNVPKTLPCLHSFCEACLQGHILRTQQTNSEIGKYFECPLCRAKTYLAKDIPGTHWVKSFPTNHCIVSLLNDSVVTNEREATIDIQCMPCKADDKQNKAYCFCIQCIEYYCKTCYEGHRKYKAFQRHTVLTGKEIPADISAFERMAKLNFCSIHPQKEIEFECRTDGKFICSICATTAHRLCENIIHLQSDDQDRTSEIKELLSDIRILKGDVEQSLDVKLKEADKLCNSSSNAKAEAIELSKQLNDFAEKLRNDFLSGYDEKLKLERKALSSVVNENFGLIENVNQLIGVAETVLKYGSNCQIALTNETLRLNFDSLMAHSQCEGNTLQTDSLVEMSICADFEQNLRCFINDNIPQRIKQLFMERKSNIDSSPVEYTVGFPTNARQEIDSVLGDTRNRPQHFASLRKNTQNINTDGDRTPTSKQNDETFVSESVTQVEQLCLSDYYMENTGSLSEQHEPETARRLPGTRSFLKMHAHRIAEYDVSVPGFSSPCSHTGSVLMSNGNMVFIDRNNHLLKVISSDFKLVCSKVLKTEPVDLCSCGENKVALAFEKSAIIIEIVDNNTNIVNRLSTEKQIRSICQVGDNLAILFSDLGTQDNDCFIQFRSSSNRILTTVDNFKNVGRKVEKLRNVVHIRSRSEDELVLCTWNHYKQVISLDQNWCERWYFKHPSLKNANSLAIDKLGNKYVSDTQSGTVIQIAAKAYKNSRTIIKDIERPASLLFNDRNKTLIVGSLSDNKVYVYQFQ